MDQYASLCHALSPSLGSLRAPGRGTSLVQFPFLIPSSGDQLKINRSRAAIQTLPNPRVLPPDEPWNVFDPQALFFEFEGRDPQALWRTTSLMMLPLPLFLYVSITGIERNPVQRMELQWSKMHLSPSIVKLTTLVRIAGIRGLATLGNLGFGQHSISSSTLVIINVRLRAIASHGGTSPIMVGFVIKIAKKVKVDDPSASTHPRARCTIFNIYAGLGTLARPSVGSVPRPYHSLTVALAARGHQLVFFWKFI
ncbi:hypothetical protein DFH06DRAFT_1137648 [Mycena polygramma]|nr:hypothetical protein DFH06DRAFT_1137648 [Mycena polygramma]